jgi:acetylornithine aminotransferase
MKSSIMDTYRRWPVEFVSGSGTNLVAADGTEYLDLLAGIAVCSVGHAHPKVARAISDQAQKLIHVSNLYRTRPQEKLAERLFDLTGGMSSFFGNSGAEAVECALKLARRWGGPTRSRIIAAHGSFHGRTFGALAATGQPSKRAAFEPMVPGFTHVTYGDIVELEAALNDDVAAVLLEPMQGEAGVVPPPSGYLRSVRSLCDAAGVLLILDEVQTGMGRTGTWFCYEHEAIAPDVVCLGKAIAGGLPMGVCLATADVAKAFVPGDHGSTFGGGPVQSAAALAVLDIIEEEGLLMRADRAGARFQHGLAQLDGAEIRGRGLLLGIVLEQPIARAVAERSFERHVLVNDATEKVIRLAPPLNITDEEIERGIAILKEVIDARRAA